MTRYIDQIAITNVIGSIYQNNSLLDMKDKYFFTEEDFPDSFHKIIFGSIYNLHLLGVESVSITAIEDYLLSRPKSFAVYQAHKGADYLKTLEETIQLNAFDYYYQRLKKFTLLRMYNETCGMNLSSLYDMDNILDAKKKQRQEDWLDNTPLLDIANLIDDRINTIRAKFADNAEDTIVNAGDGALDLIHRLKDIPDVGCPLYGDIINTVTRGARLKKFYLRSAATGVGKTRAMIADACYLACDELYDSKKRLWVKNNTSEPTLFIGTEQDKEELQTMMLAFISDVDEGNILDGIYSDEQWERVCYATQVLKRCPLFIETMPDFSLQDIENVIKHGVREYGTKFVFFDYIHTSLKILGEISSKAGVKGLREDNILFMISTRLKDLCNEYGIFILSSTQLNADYLTAQQYDQNLLRGAKAIADKIDIGMVLLEVTQDDLTALDDVIKRGNFQTPIVKMSIYKNRRGRYKNILLWCSANRGTCKINPMFATNYRYELIPIEDIRIEVTQ